MALALEKRVEEKHAWLRQPGESTQAYARFLTYRDQPPDQRSARRVGVSQSLAFRWSKRFAWVERAQAWDDHLLAEADALSVSTVLGLRRRQLDAGLTLVDSAKASATALDPAKQNAESIVLLLDAGVRHARVSLGLPAVDSPALNSPAPASVAVAFGSSASGQFGSVRVGPAWLAQPSQTERSEGEAKPNPVVQVGEQVLAEGNAGQVRAHSDLDRLVNRVVNNSPSKSELPRGVKRGAKRRDSRGGAPAPNKQ